MGETEGVTEGVTVREGVKEGVLLGVAGLEGVGDGEDDPERVSLGVGVGEDVGETLCEPAAAKKQMRRSAENIRELPLVSEQLALSEGGRGGSAVGVERKVQVDLMPRRPRRRRKSSWRKRRAKI